MRSDDLVPLLKESPGPAVGFRQGFIVTWNRETAENTVVVGRSLMTNLPILNTSEAAILAAGDVVGILTAGQTWGILGRFTIPGTPEAVTGIKAITDRIVAASDPFEGTRNSTSYGDLTGVGVGPEVTVTVGPSGRALVFWSCDVLREDVFQTHSSGDVSVALSGANTIAASPAYSLGFNLSQPPSAFDGYGLHAWAGQWSLFHLFTDLDPGETTFTMKYQVPYSTPVVATRFSAREIAVFVL